MKNEMMCEVNMARNKTQSDMEIFLSHVNPGRMDDCWIWEGCKWGKDYGSGWINGHKDGAHRVAYQLFVGEIPDGLEVMHSCNTPLCVNPAHLSLGTHAQNMEQTAGRRKDMSPARGVKHGLAKLNDAAIIEIRRLRDEGLSYQKIGQRFGVAGNTVRAVILGNAWTHISNDE